MNNSPLDVIALNETRLDHSIPSGEVGLSGYELVRLDRNRNGEVWQFMCVILLILFPAMK